MSMRRVKALQRALVRAEREHRSALQRVRRAAEYLGLDGTDDDAARHSEERYNRAYQWYLRACSRMDDAWMQLAIAPTTIGLTPRECAYLEAWTENRVAVVRVGDTCTCGD